jgi:hypothetical protein
MSTSAGLFLTLAAIATFAPVVAPVAAQAATPSFGNLSPGAPLLTYDAGPITSVNPSPQLGDPDCSLFPNSCDDYQLNVTVDAAYMAANPNHVVTIKISWPVAQNDFDVYLQDPVTNQTITSSASSGDPEIISFTPLVGTTSYRIRTLAFLAANESFHGEITLGPAPLTGTGPALYVPSGDVFTCNKHLEGQTTVFDHGGDGEPAVDIDNDGNTWIAANAGVGGGIGLWKIPSTDDCAQAPVFLDSPDAGVGGGDSDIEIAPERNALGFYNIYTSSLSLANITSSTSLDGGATFVPVVISDALPVNDRQFNAAYGANTLWLSWRSLNTGNQLFCARSDDGGLGFGPPTPVYDDVVGTALTTQLGNMVVDQRPGATVPLAAGPDGQGNLYHGYILTTQTGSSGHKVYVAVSRNFGLTWTNHVVHAGPPGATYDHIFSWLAVDAAGNVYTVWNDGSSIYYSVSTDIKTSTTPTWSLPRRVNNGLETKSCMLPMIDAGSDGRIVIAWYGTDAPSTTDPGAQWHYFHARCNNATAAIPTFEQVKVSDHVVHTGAVCEDGLGCSCCRELLECQELDVNPLDGSSLVSYGGAGGVYVTQQVAGASAIAGHTITDNSGPCPTLLDGCVSGPALLGSRCVEPGIQSVVDPTGDVSAAGDPSQDIQNVWIAEPYFGAGVRKLVFTMKVANLATLPANTLWTVLWNNPTPGDAFPVKFVQMNTCDPTASPQFSYGHVEGTIQTADGNLPAGAGTYSADGTIRLEIDPALVGNPSPGYVLSAVTGEVRLLLGTLCSGLIQTLDSGAGLPYTYEGNDYCVPHTVTCAPGDTRGPGDYLVDFTVENPSSANRAFNVTLSDPNGWLVGGPFNIVVGPVTPFSTAVVSAVLRRPNNCTPGPTDVVTFDAEATDLPLSVSTATCMSEFVCSGLSAVGPNGPAGGALNLAMAGENPFRGATRVRFDLPKKGHVTVQVYTVTGQVVRTLVNDLRESGSYVVDFDMKGDRRQELASGVYFVRVQAAGETKSLTLVAAD